MARAKTPNSAAATVLIAEEVASRAEAMRGQLEHSALRVLVARNGEQAIKVARKERPEVIIGDVALPGLSGYDLCRRIKGDEELGATAFILVTDLSSPREIFEGLSAGADDLLVRPYEAAQLVQRVRKLLRGTKAPRKRSSGKPLSVALEGRSFAVTASREQLTSFLLSTCEQAVALNEQLVEEQKELRRCNELVARAGLSARPDGCRAKAVLKADVVGTGGARPQRLQAKADAEVGDNGKSAATAQQHLRDAIACMSDGFALYDAQDNIVVRNRRYVDIRQPADGPGVLDEKPGAHADRSRKGAADGRQDLIRRRGDAWLMVREHRTDDGGVVAVETDITALKKAELAKNEFLAMVSHELRTPLTPIHGALALIASGKVAPMTSGLTELTDLAQRNCERMLSIVNDLLDFTRIASGRFSLNRRSVDIVPFLKQVVDNKSIEPGASDIPVTVSPAAAGLVLNADPLRIQQVLDNLISNAIKYTNPGSGIEVSIARRQGWLRVSVTDHGPGIPKEFRRSAFDAFTQAGSVMSQRRGGVGLGLSISKSIVEAHGGRIGFTSNQGEGATFYFELPLDEAAQRPGAAAGAHLASRAAPARLAAANKRGARRTGQRRSASGTSAGKTARAACGAPSSGAER